MASKAFNVSMASTIARKIVMAVTGIFLVIFVIGHMLGNLSFIFGGPDAYNTYSHKLISLGPLLYFIEITLLLIFIGHIVNGISVTLTNRKARPERYQTLKSTGAPSKQTLFSRTMAVTGIVLLVFTVIHLLSFKYGTYYTTTVDGVEMRDLYRLVDEKFRNPVYAFGYIAVMLLLFGHIRHGFWSAFQSLGANKPRYSNLLYTLALIIAFVVAFGFIAVPLKVYFGQFIAG
jgi:succinate dehydrogenase / fumarate reductase cytochrome b subunit